jgi:hypothetical protein
MRFLSGSQSGSDSLLVFEMTRREKALFLSILRLFPVLQNSYHHLSHDPKNAQTPEQRLLEDSMAQQRLDSRGRLDEFFHHQERFFTEAQPDVLLTLSPDQTEWLLRVLNDIRVGSWIQLGRPELDAVRHSPLPREQAQAFAAMEMSGYFQFSLLQAFH